MATVPPGSSQRPLLTLVVAAILAIFYILASWYLLERFALDNPLPETSWQRALIIYNGVASVGFAAIGVLLGTSVQQANLNSARQDAATAKASADKKADTIKGALDKLTSEVKGQPNDLGGGAMSEESRRAEVRQILLAGLE